MKYILNKNMKKGIITFFYEYIKYLRKEKNKIATLQLTSRIEDFLVKEFIYFLHKKSRGNIFAYSNLGKAGERKYDVCIFKGKSFKEKIIYAFIEAKYFRNIHRADINQNAEDEIPQTIKSLKKQLSVFNKNRHCNYDVELSSLRKSIYGMVFVSWVSEKNNDPRKKQFYNIIMNIAKNFRYHDFKKPYLRNVYNDININIINQPFFVSLKMGLWIKK